MDLFIILLDNRLAYMIISLYEVHYGQMGQKNDGTG